MVLLLNLTLIRLGFTLFCIETCFCLVFISLRFTLFLLREYSLFHFTAVLINTAMLSYFFSVSLYYAFACVLYPCIKAFLCLLCVLNCECIKELFISFTINVLLLISLLLLLLLLVPILSLLLLFHSKGKKLKKILMAAHKSLKLN